MGETKEVKRAFSGNREILFFAAETVYLIPDPFE
jgi:hypothetical protein